MKGFSVERFPTLIVLFERIQGRELGASFVEGKVDGLMARITANLIQHARGAGGMDVSENEINLVFNLRVSIPLMGPITPSSGIEISGFSENVGSH